MKLTGGRWDSFVQKPNPEVTAVLLFGTEPGTVQHRAKTLVSAWLAGTDDPFALTSLSAEELSRDPNALFDAARQATLLAGPRVVRLSGITENHRSHILKLLDDPARIARIVIEAGNLTPRSKLRGTFEKDDQFVAAGCYPLEGRALSDYVARRFAQENVRVETESLALLTERLSDNLGQVEQEIDKLALLAGPDGHLDADLIDLALGSASEASIDDLLHAIALGDFESCERSLAKMGSGQSAVGLLRALLRHLTRLHQARCRMDAGDTPDRAIASLIPPVFPRQKGQFSSEINRLRRSTIETMIELATDAERGCKSGPLPDTALANQCLLTVCRLARRG